MQTYKELIDQANEYKRQAEYIIKHKDKCPVNQGSGFAIKKAKQFLGKE